MAMFKCRISAAPYNDKVYLHSVLMVSIVSQIQIRVLAILLKIAKAIRIEKNKSDASIITYSYIIICSAERNRANLLLGNNSA